MHEFSIAQTIFAEVCNETKKRNISNVKSIVIEVGKMAAVVPAALEFSFETIIKGTFLEGAALVIEEIPFKATCEQCGITFEVKDYNLQCPDCGSRKCELASGDELVIKRLEVE